MVVTIEDAHEVADLVMHREEIVTLIDAIDPLESLSIAGHVKVSEDRRWATSFSVTKDLLIDALDHYRGYLEFRLQEIGEGVGAEDAETGRCAAPETANETESAVDRDLRSVENGSRATGSHFAGDF